MSSPQMIRMFGLSAMWCSFGRAAARQRPSHAARAPGPTWLGADDGTHVGLVETSNVGDPTAARLTREG